MKPECPEKSDISKCTCCGADTWRTHTYTDIISYRECLNCHYFVQLQFTPEDRAFRFEVEQQKFYDDSSLFLSPNFSLLNSEVTNRRISTIRRYLPPGASVIEAGPGAGDVLLALDYLGYAATGVEHSATLARHLKDKPNISVFVGDFADQPLPAATYDAYCSFHVIEHVVDFKKHLGAARDCVKPGGYAFIATPNSQGWEHRLPFRLSPNFDSSHFQLFSPSSLNRVLRECGWDVVTTLTPSYAMAWLRVVTKIIRRIRRQHENTTGGHYVKSTSNKLRIAVSAFSTITRPFRFLQEALAGGNEQFIVARRSYKTRAIDDPRR